MVEFYRELSIVEVNKGRYTYQVASKNVPVL
jgi:hypothetical protein